MATEKSLDVRMGQVLIRNKACSLRDVNHAFAEQRRLRSENRRATLTEILIAQGVISEDDARASLAAVGQLCLYCSRCDRYDVLRSYRPDRDANCAICGEPRVAVEPDVRKEALRGAQESSAAAAAPDESRSSPAEPDPRGARSETPAQPVETEPVGNPKRADFRGAVLGGCEIVEKIANGGMGVVYKALQLNLGRTVAVKVLAEDLAKDTNFIMRFQQEARAAAQLNHGGIVHINDVGEESGTFYFVMEYVDGENLKTLLESGVEFSVAQTIEIMIQVCKALRHAHHRGIIHRDIKPENIMITKDELVKLADLGLAKRVSEESAGLTHAGSILGTPYYMAPEQAKDFSKVDVRSDIYSLGVTIYRLLTGQVPFYGRSPIEVMIKAIDGNKTPMRELRSEIPVEIEALVDRMMHKMPSERYQCVDEVLEDLMKIDVSLKSAAAH